MLITVGTRKYVTKLIMQCIEWCLIVPCAVKPIASGWRNSEESYELKTCRVTLVPVSKHSVRKAYGIRYVKTFILTSVVVNE
jgi:hypothetical protein